MALKLDSRLRGNDNYRWRLMTDFVRNGQGSFNFRLIILLACLLLPATQALADPVTVQAAGKKMLLILPEKACAYDPQSKYDAGVLETIKKANPKDQLLLAFADCDALKLRRDGKKPASPGYFGQILSNEEEQEAADVYTREAYVKAAAERYDAQSPEKNMEEGEQVVKAMAGGGKDAAKAPVNGIIRKDKDFIQVVVIGTGTMPGGETQNIVNIVTLTKLGVPVSIYLGRPVTAGMTLGELSRHAEIYTRELLGLNPESSSSRDSGMDMGSLFAGFAGGLAAAWLAGRVKKRMRKGCP
jgi:hypothetical protein